LFRESDSLRDMILHTIVCAGSLALGALTPAKVSNVTTNPSALPATKPPAVIYVRSFSVSQTAAKADDGDGESSGGRPHLFGMLRGGEDNTLIGRHREEQQDETLAKLPGILQRALIENLNKSIAPAANGDGAQATRWDCWVIAGQFLTVDQGNRALQAGIGFGAGQSQVEVQAQVYTLRDMGTPFLVFDSKGASGHMPGAIVMHNPYVAAAKFVMSKKEPDKEAKKVATSIAEAIGKFMTAQGIPTLKEMKEAGETPVPSSAQANSSSKGNR
jgi:Domain of unknown function (DUF4410)